MPKQNKPLAVSWRVKGSKLPYYKEKVADLQEFKERLSWEDLKPRDVEFEPTSYHSIEL